MELRKELSAPKIPNARLGEVKQRIEEIEEALAQGRDADSLISAFAAFTGRQYDKFEFSHYWEAVSLDHFAREASRPPPPRVEGVTREELIEVVRRAMPTSGDPDFEYYMEVFNANVPMPRAAMLIYYPPEELAGEQQLGTYDPTPEEIVERALAWRPSVLDGPRST